MARGGLDPPSPLSFHLSSSTAGGTARRERMGGKVIIIARSLITIKPFIPLTVTFSYEMRPSNTRELLNPKFYIRSGSGFIPLVVAGCVCVYVCVWWDSNIQIPKSMAVIFGVTSHQGTSTPVRQAQPSNLYETTQTHRIQRWSSIPGARFQPEFKIRSTYTYRSVIVRSHRYGRY